MKKPTEFDALKSLRNMVGATKCPGCGYYALSGRLCPTDGCDGKPKLKRTYEVAVTRVTYYKVVANDGMRATDLALSMDDCLAGERCSEETTETTGHSFVELVSDGRGGLVADACLKAAVAGGSR